MGDYTSFKKKVYGLTGLDLSLYKEKQMKRRLDTRIARSVKGGYDEYFELISSDREAFNQFMNYLTINVSEFFRNPEQWTVLEKKVLPELLKNTSKLKVWSAACSTGEEPYTLVMVLSRLLPLSDISVIASDIDDNAILKAKQGIYTEKSILNVPYDLKSKYFEKDGLNYRISDEIKNKVRFEKMNLLSDNFQSSFDLIVCRNVMIYFTDEAKNYLYEAFNRALKHGGNLFVGSTEQIVSPRTYGFVSEYKFFYKKDN